MAIFYRTAFHSGKWLIFQYLSIQLLGCNFKSIWPTEMYYISKDCIFNGRSAGAFRFSVECVLTEIYWAQVWKFFLHQTLAQGKNAFGIFYINLKVLTFLKIFIMIFRPNEAISMCSLLKYGKSVVKCLIVPLAPGKSRGTRLVVNKWFRILPLQAFWYCPVVAIGNVSYI